MKKVTHVTGHLGTSGGGVFAFVRSIADQELPGFQQEVLGVNDPSDPHIGDAYRSFGTRRGFERRGLFSPGLRDAIAANARNSHVLHLHEAWDAPVAYLRRSAKRFRTPFVLSTHGMLMPYRLGLGRYRKKVLYWAMLRRAAQQASVIHVLSTIEEAAIRAKGIQTAIAHIPIGIRVDDYTPCEDARSRVDLRWPQLRGRRILLFLSRVERVKGLPPLLEALQKLPPTAIDGWTLVIAGPEERGYLSTLARRYGAALAAPKVEVLGPVYGQDKLDLFAAASLFALTSFSENFGIVVAEALSSGTPVVTSTAMPWKAACDFGCGWEVEPNSSSIADALFDAFHKDDAALNAMGRRGREWVASRLNCRDLEHRWVDLYSSLSERADLPASLADPVL